MDVALPQGGQQPVLCEFSHCSDVGLFRFKEGFVHEDFELLSIRQANIRDRHVINVRQIRRAPTTLDKEGKIPEVPSKSSELRLVVNYFVDNYEG